jgi:hypothetical protein
MKHKSFHSYWFGLDGQGRARLARRIKTSAGYLEKLAGGFGAPSADMAGRIIRETGLSFDAIMAKFNLRHGGRRAR